jgi:hypothetical protein
MESWFEQIPWFDNLEVLRNEHYLATPGPYFEPMIGPSWEITALEICNEEKDVSRVSFYAQGYELVGYSFAAQAMRDRANALIAFLDVSLTEEQKDVVRKLLQYEKRPPKLVEIARQYEARGYPMAGNALRDRASLLRIARKPIINRDPVVWPWPKGQPTTP